MSQILNQSGCIFVCITHTTRNAVFFWGMVSKVHKIWNV